MVDILNFSNKLKSDIILKRDSIFNKFNGKQKTIGVNAVKNWINELVKVILHNIQVDENSSQTPTNSNDIIYDTIVNNDSNDNNPILDNEEDLKCEDFDKMSMESVVKTLHRNMTKFQESIRYIESKLSKKPFIKKNSISNNNYRNRKQCWSCGIFGHLSYNCNNQRIASTFAPKAAQNKTTNYKNFNSFNRNYDRSAIFN